jgi:hypothetical protein
MANLDEILKISLIVLVIAITLAVVLQLGMILLSINSILKDVKKVTRTAVADAYKTRTFAVESAVLLVETLFLQEFNKIKSGALGSALKVFKLFHKKINTLNS